MKKILITGATGGIGKEICRLLKNDYDIYVMGRNQEKLDKLKEELPSLEDTFIADLNNRSSIESFLDTINKNNLEFDILVNNAGVTQDSLFIRMDYEKWSKVIQTNLNSNFLLTNFFSKQMIKKKWGRIINITSVVCHTGNAGQSNYTASKSGIIGMSKSIAAELAKRNITVNCISPGFIETEMTSDLSEEQKKLIMDKIPLNRIGQPKDVANCVKFLASDMSEYITGQTIHVNGGLAML
jgi:3-oxoacyl-[acyl-carrier protein] reductase